MILGFFAGHVNLGTLRKPNLHVKVMKAFVRIKKNIFYLLLIKNELYFLQTVRGSYSHSRRKTGTV